MLFEGLATALVTPFKGSKINYDVFKQLIDDQIKAGVDFLVFIGTTGESPTLSLKEKKAIIDFAVSYVNKRVAVVIGTGNYDTKACVKLSLYAKSAGADGLLIVTPYYNNPTQEGLYAHYKHIATKVNHPIILYNVPSRTGVNLLPKTVGRLSLIPNIVGIKEASGDLEQMKTVIACTPEDFIVVSGNDDQMLDCLKLGGHGIISVASHIIPIQLKKQITDFKAGKNVDDAFASYKKIHQVLFIESNPSPVKYALSLLGYNVGNPRLPLVKVSRLAQKQIDTVLKESGIIA